MKLQLRFPVLGDDDEQSMRAGLALGRDDAPLHLDWIVATMAFLAALALVGALATADASARWQRGLTGTATVEIAASPQAAESADRLQRVLAVLRSDPAIVRAEPLPRARLAELLAPWLGSGSVIDSLPVPQLVDVTLRPAADLRALARRLVAAAPGTTLDDHGMWIDQLLRLARLAVGLATAVVVLVALTAVAAVVLATRAGLAVHHDATDLLHLIGAEDAYIARQFAYQGMLLGFRGGALGLLAAAIVLVALGIAGHRVDAALVPSLWPGLLEVLPLLLVPPATAALAWLTARQTVMRALKKMV